MTRTTLCLLVGATLAFGPAACTKKKKNDGKSSGQAQGEAMDYSLPPDDFETGDQNNPGGRNRPPRMPRPAGPEMAGSHILIAYKGATRARPNVTRTKEEAKAFATKLLAQITKDPKKFEALAKEHSNGPTGKRGGFLGAWRQGRMVPAFDKAISALKINEIAKEPVETRFGFHIMKRMPLPPTYAGAHILIAYKGARRARPDVTRTKEEALAHAKKLAAELKKDPKKFEEYAKKHSNGPSASRGGSLGKWKKGRMVPAFDAAIEKMKIGQVSDPVETPFGFHVIIRNDPKTVPDRPRMPRVRRR